MELVAMMMASLMAQGDKQQDQRDEICYEHKGKLVTGNLLQASLHHYKMYDSINTKLHPVCSIRVFGFYHEPH